MSEDAQQTKEKDNLNRVADAIFDAIKKCGIDDVDTIRRGTGMVLSGIHTAMLAQHEKSDGDTKAEVAMDCWHSMQVLMESFNDSLKKHGYESYVEQGRIIDGEHIPEGKIQ